MNTIALKAHLLAIAEMNHKLNEPWKAFAFGKVANALPTHLNFDKQGHLTTEVRGVGKAIRDVIEEFAAGGTSHKFAKLKKQLPAEAEIPRHNSQYVASCLKKLMDKLSCANIVWTYAGSMRRGLPTIKDIDVVIVLRNQNDQTTVQAWMELNGLKADVRNGEVWKGITIKLSETESILMDLQFTTPEEFGAMMLYFTGPKDFNIRMRSKAKAMGLTLNQHGLWNGKKKCAAASTTEPAIFEALGMKYIGPMDRS